MESAYISYTLNVNQHATATGNVLALSKGAESAFETLEWNVGGSVERIKKTANIIVSYTKKGFKVIVVSSAMSGVTNDLV